MAHVPRRESAAYALLESRQDFSRAEGLQYPQDCARIARLSLAEKQAWWAQVNPEDMEAWESDPAFRRWWKHHYLWPLKLKRLVFKLKVW